MKEKIKIDIGNIVNGYEVLNIEKSSKRKLYLVKCLMLCGKISLRRKEEFLKHKCLCNFWKNPNTFVDAHTISVGQVKNGKKILEINDGARPYKISCLDCCRESFQTKAQFLKSKCYCKKYSNKYKIGNIYNNRKFIGYSGKSLISSGRKYPEATVVCVNCKQISVGKIHNLAQNSCKVCSNKNKGVKLRKDPWEMQYEQLQNGAKHRGLEFTLSFDDFKAKSQSPCFYCGAQPNQKVTRYNSNLKRTGIDRIDNNIGYTTNNTIPSCFIHNKMKSNSKKEEFINGCLTVVFGHKFIEQIKLYNLSNIDIITIIRNIKMDEVLRKLSIPGGNDYAVKQCGVDCLETTGPDQTLELIKQLCCPSTPELST